MSDELTGLIMGALENAESGNDGGGGEADTHDSGGDSSASVTETAGETGDTSAEPGLGADSGADTIVPPPGGVADDPLTAELEELGLRTPEPGSNNRIPYPRVKKIIANAIEKREKAHKALLDDLNGKYTSAQQRAEAADRVDRLIIEDPARYFQLLETLHPKAKDAIAAFRNPPKPAAPVASPLGDEPGMDMTFEDGSKGYSAAQWQKHQVWVRESIRQEALTEAESRFEQKYGSTIAPIVQAERNRAVQNEATQIVAQKASEAEKIWGKTFTDEFQKPNNGEFGKYAIANPKATFEQVIQAVLVPRLTAERTKMRKEVLDEGNVRASAAAKNVSAGKAPKVQGEAMTLEAQMMEAMEAAGIV